MPGRAGAGRIDRLAAAGRRQGSLRAGIRRQLHATEPPAHPGAGLARTGLSLRLADSEVTRRWLRNESDPAARELFFREADGYRRDLLGRAYFIASAATGNYYFNDDQPLSEAPRYTLSRGAADDGWFYKSLQASALYNINVNPDLKLKTTRVWINAQVRDGDKVLGLTGAGLDVGGFLRDFVNSGQAGVTPIIVDETGAIQAHMDPTLIAYNSGAGGADGRGMVFSLLDPGGARNCARPCTRRRPIHSRCSRPGSRWTATASWCRWLTCPNCTGMC